MAAADGLVVRPAVPADGPAWRRLRRALWPDEDAEELGADVDLYFAGRDTLLRQVLVAIDDDGRAVGFAELSTRAYAEGCTTSPVAYLEGWYVAPEHRRQGVGGALIRAAEAWGRAEGCSEFASDALLENEISAAAHVALGFAEVERIRCFRKALPVGSPPAGGATSHG